jgi:hypothetical protein
MALCNEMQVNVQTLSSNETLHDRLVELSHGKTDSEFLPLSSQQMANSDDAAPVAVAAVWRSCPFEDLKTNICALGHSESYENSMM